ncbi:MAG: hypothetical protein ACXACC_09425 [Promethearchaeota archaeon]|jgi:hypothetical protein
MSELQETDKVMRVFAVIGGIVSTIEAILVITGTSIMPYNFGILGLFLSLAASILVIGLGIRPIHYTPTFLGILGVGLIVLAVLIGGIIVLLATFIGAIS